MYESHVHLTQNRIWLYGSRQSDLPRFWHQRNTDIDTDKRAHTHTQPHAATFCVRIRNLITSVFNPSRYRPSVGQNAHTHGRGRVRKHIESELGTFFTFAYPFTHYTDHICYAKDAKNGKKTKRNKSHIVDRRRWIYGTHSQSIENYIFFSFSIIFHFIHCNWVVK